LKPIIDAYPLGQTHIDDVTDQVSLVASDTIREDAGMFRFDYRFNNNNTAFVRYNVDNAYIDTPTDALGGQGVVPHIPTNVVLQYQRVISPRTATSGETHGYVRTRWQLVIQCCRRGHLKIPTRHE
jgi:hypothetical protein